MFSVPPDSQNEGHVNIGGRVFELPGHAFVVHARAFADHVHGNPLQHFQRLPKGVAGRDAAGDSGGAQLVEMIQFPGRDGLTKGDQV